MSRYLYWINTVGWAYRADDDDEDENIVGIKWHNRNRGIRPSPHVESLRLLVGHVSWSLDALEFAE